MSSIFAIYNIANTGMSVNQTGLTVTSQNLSNIQTSGYSRQRSISQETTTAVQSSVSAVSGASVQTIERLRNQLLDQTYRQQNAKLGYWETKSANLEDAQIVLDEFTADDGSVGLQQAIEDLLTSWDELSKDPSNLTNRQTVLENAEYLLDLFAECDEQLQNLQYDATDKVKSDVAELNDLARQVAELNGQIQRAEVKDVEASELRDQRDSLLDSMSALANITVNIQADGTLQASIGGVYLVSGTKTHTLTATGDGSAQDPLQVQWEELNEPAAITSGSIAANLADADQRGVQTVTTIPYSYASGQTDSSLSSLRQGLNTLLTAIVNQINSLHSAGTGLDGSSGLDFFVADDSSQALGARNIQINSLLIADTDKIAAGSSGAAGDNSIAAAIAALLDDATLFQFDGQTMNAADFYQALISWVGTAGSTANGHYQTQSALVAQVDSSRQSVSSVSLDEELANMIQYQNAYSASARVLSTIDSLLADLIDEIG